LERRHWLLARPFWEPLPELLAGPLPESLAEPPPESPELPDLLAESVPELPELPELVPEPLLVEPLRWLVWDSEEELPLESKQEALMLLPVLVLELREVQVAKRRCLD